MADVDFDTLRTTLEAQPPGTVITLTAAEVLAILDRLDRLERRLEGVCEVNELWDGS